VSHRLRFGALGVLAVLVAAPGVHLFEVWLPRPVAFWVSHGLAALLLALVGWRWAAARARAPAPGRRAA
jgi:hypothetical protein